MSTPPTRLGLLAQFSGLRLNAGLGLLQRVGVYFTIFGVHKPRRYRVVLIRATAPLAHQIVPCDDPASNVDRTPKEGLRVAALPSDKIDVAIDTK